MSTGYQTEERIEALEARVVELEDALRSIGVHFLQTPHNKLGNACGRDACILCLAQTTALEALGKP